MAQSVAFSVCHPGDLVMNKYQAHAGSFACAVERGLITANYSVFAPGRAANTAYYALLFASESYRTAFLIESYGVGDGMMPLYTKAFYRVPCVVPPLEEQADIVRFLNHANRRLRLYLATRQKLVGTGPTSGGLVREYRDQLVSDVVTGKLDVHEAAARLPDEAVEPGSLDGAGMLTDDGESEVDADLSDAVGQADA